VCRIRPIPKHRNLLMKMNKQTLLTPDEIRHFNEEGYLLYHKPVFSQARFEGLKNCFEGLLEQQVEGGRRPEAMDKPHFLHPELFEWILGDEVLDLVEPLLGPDFHFFVSHFICKPSSDGKRVPWHEDSAYWKGILKPMEAVTVWLAIDPSTEVNGCMKLVPYSHRSGRRGFSDYANVDTSESVFPTEIVESQQRGQEVVSCHLQPNEASIHESKVIHGSDPNTSDIRRCGFTMRFVPAHVRLMPEWEEALRLYPARGQDKAGNKLADPSKAYPELDPAQSGSKVH